MIVSIERKTGKLIRIKESESMDFEVLANHFARSTLPIWQAQMEKSGPDGDGAPVKEKAEAT